MFKRTLKIVLLAVSSVTLYASWVQASGMEDPLRPPEFRSDRNATASSKPKVQTWSVNEILFSGERRVAIVNDTAVAVGDRVDGARVVEIKPAYVVLEYKNRMITASLKATIIKTKTAIN